jgi:hypothetical protein
MSVQDKPRKLKVYYTYHSNSRTRKPMIRLGGKYLDMMGFNIGDTIQVSMEGSWIVITKVETSKITKGA